VLGQAAKLTVTSRRRQGPLAAAYRSTVMWSYGKAAVAPGAPSSAFRRVTLKSVSSSAMTVPLNTRCCSSAVRLSRFDRTTLRYAWLAATVRAGTLGTVVCVQAYHSAASAPRAPSGGAQEPGEMPCRPPALPAPPGPTNVPPAQPPGGAPGRSAAVWACCGPVAPVAAQCAPSGLGRRQRRPRGRSTTAHAPYRLSRPANWS
jgi:hypothetical protein